MLKGMVSLTFGAVLLLVSAVDAGGGNSCGMVGEPCCPGEGPCNLGLLCVNDTCLPIQCWRCLCISGNETVVTLCSSTAPSCPPCPPGTEGALNLSPLPCSQIPGCPQSNSAAPALSPLGFASAAIVLLGLGAVALRRGRTRH